MTAGLFLSGMGAVNILAGCAALSFERRAAGWIGIAIGAATLALGLANIAMQGASP